MSEYLLEIKDERLSFFTPAGEVKALNGVSIHMKEGEVLGIVGESGSGKSVTAYSLMGLTAYPGKLIGGTLDFNGHRVNDMTEKEMRKMRGNEVSIIFQDPMTSLNPVYTIGNQIEEVIRLHTNKTKQEAKERARELFGEFQRKFDLVRWGIYYETVSAKSDYSSLKKNLKPCHRYYPIPDTEVAKSKNVLDNEEYEQYGF